jgi:hypothetical protein
MVVCRYPSDIIVVNRVEEPTNNATYHADHVVNGVVQ